MAQGSEELRWCSLGLSDEQTGRHTLSEVHLRVLAAIGKLRRRGGYQTELAADFKMAAGSFFYVIKVG